MTELHDRLTRYVEDEVCACVGLTEHLSKLHGMKSVVDGDLVDLVTILKAVAEENRLKILLYLDSSPLCACELEYLLELAQPTITYHLQILRKAGLIRMEREGKWTTISLLSDELPALLRKLQTITGGSKSQ